MQTWNCFIGDINLLIPGKTGNENEREVLLEEVANERAAMMMSGGRADLMEVVQQRNEIERLQNELHIAHDRMTMMETMLAEAQSVISALGAH